MIVDKSRFQKVGIRLDVSKTRSLRPSDSDVFNGRRPVAEKYRMKAERAWFLSEGEKSEA